ncbi:MULTISPECIES: enoyl-CoA hydratase/isomerase family protein [unclassified Streptomyces]|uniref:enoyl-CoA hydratase/isomerase family protein n=1 Tax=unclassified Streptomyces TaxID=2593676 RepID=UPI00225A1007|nr:enoyl-CoA hydratase/isomerase family protein [Streptomyces sp. NBC_00047]MCX5609947.1 enoyl-CoA hydratase/isomerase family protein [Streptomyces sp. NBC_00047]
MSSYDEYTSLRVAIDAGVARVTLDNPPVNMLDTALINELHDFAGAVRGDDRVRVIVVQSADPDFFAAHVDLSFMLKPETFAELANPNAGTGGDESLLNPMQKLMLRFRTLPQVTIAKLAGRLRGGGNELAMALDMRFAATGRTWLAQPETRMGIIPGGGGTQLLTPLVGRARALEVILGGNLFDAELAERYGWINRTLPAEELDGFVDALAGRIAALRPEQIAAAKAAVGAASTGGGQLLEGLAEESKALAGVYPAPDAVVERMRAAVEAGAQTREGELDLEASLDRVAW